MTGPVDDAFTVTDAEVRAGRALPAPSEAERARRDREITFIVGLAGLAIGCGLAWLPLGFIVPATIITAIALWSRGGAS